MLRFKGSEASNNAIGSEVGGEAVWGRQWIPDDADGQSLHRGCRWDNVVEVYASDLVHAEDLALIKQAVRTIVEGGIEAGWPLTFPPARDRGLR